MLDTKVFSDVAMDIAKQQEELILESLGELITRGLLVVEKTQPVLVGRWERDRDKYTVELRQNIKLVLKDQEYIEKLEKENKELNARLQAIIDTLHK